MFDGQPIAVFQPFVDTATGLIAGVEALARLRDSHGRLRSAGPLFACPQTNQSALRRLDRRCATRPCSSCNWHRATGSSA